MDTAACPHHALRGAARPESDDPVDCAVSPGETGKARFAALLRAGAGLARGHNTASGHRWARGNRPRRAVSNYSSRHWPTPGRLACAKPPIAALARLAPEQCVELFVTALQDVSPGICRQARHALETQAAECGADRLAAIFAQSPYPHVRRQTYGVEVNDTAEMGRAAACSSRFMAIVTISSAAQRRI